MTGLIQFLPSGQRVNYTLLLMKLFPGGKTANVGIYQPPAVNSKTGNVTLFPVKLSSNYTDGFKHNAVLKVTTLVVSQSTSSFT